MPNHRTTETLKNWLTETLACRPAAWARLKASPLGYRLARGAFWSLVGAVLSRGLGLVATIVVARILGKEGFGELGIIQSTVGMFGTFAGFGLGLTATKHVAELREKDPERASRILALSAVVAWGTGGLGALALALTSPWLAAHTLAAPHLAPELRIGSLLVLLGAVNGAQTGALSGFEAFKRIAQLNLWAGLINFPCLTVGCWVGGLKGAVWGLVVAQALGCALNRWGLALEGRKHEVTLWSSRWRDELAVLWRFSLPVLMGSVVVAPVYWAVQALLANQPGGYGQLAIFRVGQTWSQAAQYLATFLGMAFMPVLASISKGPRVQQRNLILQSTFFSGLTTAIAAGTAFAASPWILASYGPGFEDGGQTFAILLGVAVVSSSHMMLFNTLLALGCVWTRLAANSLWGAVTTSLAICLIPRAGAVGLASALLVGHTAHLLLLASIVSSRVRAEGTHFSEAP